MSWKRKVFDSFRLYGVTDISGDKSGLLKKIDQAYAGGADIIQLRSKGLCDGELYRMGEAISRIAKSRKKLFFVNDRLGLALTLRADGLHLGQDDLPVNIVKRYCSRAGLPMFLGKSTHSLQQARKAEREGVDYIGIGPVFGTPTKPDYQPIGLRVVRRVTAEIHLPVVAIGGIDLSNLETVLKAGARRIAVVRALFKKENTYANACQFKKKLQNSCD